MNDSQPRRDGLLALGLFGLGILTRLPFQSQILYHWDSVNFALALERFDVQLHQPQPPGYVLYVLLGRIFNLVFHDANTSLVWISILFSGLTVAAIFWLGRAMFGRMEGLVAAGLALTGPLFWFHGEVALSYITEGFFVTAIAWCCYRQHQTGDGRYAIATAALLGIAGGFRQSTLVLLSPLWLFSLWRLTWRKRIASAATLALIVGGWLGLMLYWSGGLDKYVLALGSQAQGNLEISAAGAGSTLATNLSRLAVYGVYALTIGVALLPIAMIRFVRHRREWLREPRWQILLVWTLPSLVFYTFFVQQAGYTFTFMPAAVLIVSVTALDLIRWAARRTHGAGWASVALGVLLLSNVVFFLAAPPFLFGQKKQLLNATSWPAINARNVGVSAKLDYIRTHFPADSTAVLADPFDFRLPDYYLRDYQLPSLSHEVSGLADGAALPDAVRVVVLFNAELPDIGGPDSVMNEAQLPGGERLRWLERSDEQAFVVAAGEITLKDRAGQ
jgi:4-amino-4-deoxy-L-arabinose transferase-like glycosyltransferase